MKKLAPILFLALLCLGMFGSAVQSTHATADYRLDIQKQADAFGGKSGANLGGVYDIRIIAALILRYAMGVVGVIFLGYAVYAGYTIMTSQGEEDKVAKARSTLRTSIIGIIVLFAAYSITILVSTAVSLTQQPQNPGFSIHFLDSNYGGR